MSHNFKPGDLAVVIRSHLTENLGRVVEVEVDFGVCSEARFHGVTYNGGGELFHVVGVTMIEGEFCAVNDFGMPQSAKHWVVKRSCLMPLRGDFAPAVWQKSQEVSE